MWIDVPNTSLHPRTALELGESNITPETTAKTSDVTTKEKPEPEEISVVDADEVVPWWTALSIKH